MHLLLLTAWLCLPIAPLNPIEQDTLPDLSFHLSGGIAGSNGIVSSGPRLSGKFEMLLIHPWAISAGAEYRFATVTSHLFPRGDLNQVTLSSDILYYRGTDRLTGYIGFGALYAVSGFGPNQGTADSLRLRRQIVDIDISSQWGYRLALGLRFNRVMSLEIAVTELRPRFVFRGNSSPGQFSQHSQETRIGGFQITVGRVWEILPHR